MLTEALKEVIHDIRSVGVDLQALASALQRKLSEGETVGNTVEQLEGERKRLAQILSELRSQLKLK